MCLLLITFIYLVSRSGKYVIKIVNTYYHSIYLEFEWKVQCNTMVRPWLVFQQKNTVLTFHSSSSLEDGKRNMMDTIKPNIVSQSGDWLHMVA